MQLRASKLTLKEWQKEVWQVADEHGWHQEEATIGDRLALIHAEISEALEEYRDGKMNLYFEWDKSVIQKPEGFGIELADAIIRILHLAEIEGLDMDYLVTLKNAYNKTRPFRHGGKKI